MSYRPNMRKKFTNDEITNAMNEADGNMEMASLFLTRLGKGVVSRQLLNYWWKHLNKKKKNGEPYIGTTVLDREIRENEVLPNLRTPSPRDYEAEYTGNGTIHEPHNQRILVFGDVHAPYHHPDAIAFLTALHEELNFSMILCDGDETDGHALSFHESDPALDAAGPELYKAQAFMAELEMLFPVIKFCHSNHGSLVYRRAKKAGIPVDMIKTYREILFPNGGGEGWSWHDEIRVTLPNGEDFQLEHTRGGGVMRMAEKERACAAHGHLHGQSSIEYASSKVALYWASMVGCLLDPKSIAFEYGKTHSTRPIISVLVILDALPIIIPMELTKDGRWNGRIPKLGRR